MSHVRKRILLVDDEELLRIVYTRLFERFGHEVIVAENGARAWEILCRSSEVPFDLIVSDHTMFEMSGWALLSVAKASNDTAKIDFVLWSSDDMGCIDGEEVPLRPRVEALGARFSMKGSDEKTLRHVLREDL